jgi:hypothetical protein
MEAMLGISLYSFPYLKLAKMLSFLLLLMSSLQQNWRRIGSAWERGEGNGAEAGGRGGFNNVYTYEYMNKE